MIQGLGGCLGVELWLGKLQRGIGFGKFSQRGGGVSLKPSLTTESRNRGSSCLRVLHKGQRQGQLARLDARPRIGSYIRFRTTDMASYLEMATIRGYCHVQLQPAWIAVHPTEVDA